MAAKLNCAIWILTALRDRDRRFLHGHCKRCGKKVDMSGYSKDENRPLPIGKNKKVIGLMKDELGRKVMTELLP